MYLITNTYAQILSCITIPFFLQKYAIGMNYPILLENAPSINAFKRSLNSTLIGVPLLYVEGKRIGQI